MYHVGAKIGNVLRSHVWVAIILRHLYGHIERLDECCDCVSGTQAAEIL